jgi:hypothetical protein
MPTLIKREGKEEPVSVPLSLVSSRVFAMTPETLDWGQKATRSG